MTKEMMRQQKAHEEAELAQKNHEKQMEQKNAIAQRLAQKQHQAMSEADRLKQERYLHEEMIKMQKTADWKRAESMKQMIRQ